jgi:hypothetical protein
VLSHAQFTLLVAALFIGGIALMAVALSGTGSRDRSRPVPRLPAQDLQDKRDDDQS